MKPLDDYRNGDCGGSGGSRAGSASGSEDEGGDAGAEDELSLADAGAPARALAALNALRKSRQHFDCVLVAEGAEVPAHRAVLAAASPYLLEALAATPPAGAGAPVALRVEGVDAEALRTLVEYAYTGVARVREAGAARRLYRAAWRLRVEPVRAHLAERLARRPAPADALPLRALPDLEPRLLRDLDAYIANNFDEICEIGALATLPKINIEMLRESSAEDGEETTQAVAGAALAWLRDRQTPDCDLEELCSRTHLVFVDARGALRDCGELPASRDEAPALGEYRREAAERERVRRPKEPAKERAPRPLELGARAPRAGGAGECCVIAARAGVSGATRALVLLRGRLAAARVSWRAAGGGVARGGVLGGAGAREPERGAGARLAALAHPRCAHGTAAFDGRIVVAGGYDRARVLRSTEAFDPHSNAWLSLADMATARARFPAARCGDALFALGGSDGHADLDCVHALKDGVWQKVTKLPLARTHAAAAADETRGALYAVGGWAGGLSLRRVDRFCPAERAWSDAPPLDTGRSQCAAVVWEDALWVLGGCDAWHCLASVETLRLGAGGAWEPGPALPTARRSVGGAVWRGRLVSAGGSARGASLRRTDWLLAGAAEWRPGPDLRVARASLGLAALGGALYAVGGFDGKEFLSCVECLHEPDEPWTSLYTPPKLPATVTNVPEQETVENGEVPAAAEAAAEVAAAVSAAE